MCSLQGNYKLKLFFNSVDCYVNVVGGFKLKDPACDLAVALSLVCALKNVDVLKDLIMRRSNQKNVETKEYPYNIPVINLFILLDL